MSSQKSTLLPKPVSAPTNTSNRLAPQIPAKPTTSINRNIQQKTSNINTAKITDNHHVSKRINVIDTSEYTQVVKLNKKQSIIERNGDIDDYQETNKLREGNYLKSNHRILVDLYRRRDYY